MFAGLLVFIGHFFEEISASASKHAFSSRVLSYTLYGFLAHFMSALFFGVYAYVEGNSFVYNLHAWPIFLLRLVTEVIQCEIVYRAIVVSDRTSFGFARILTIPLLLLVDIALGYSLLPMQFLGIGVICIALLAYFGAEHGKGNGVRLALLSALLSVVNISLYKYDITHYNKAMVVQFFMALTLMLFYGFRVAYSKADRALLYGIKEHPYLGVMLVSQSVATLLISLAYGLAPASLVLAFSRASAVIWSLISGVFYFHEQRVLKKVFVTAVLTLGLLFLVTT